MKNIRIGLIILGIVLLVGGLTVAVKNLNSGEQVSCASVAVTDKELENAINEWKTGMETSQEPELKKKVEESSQLFFQAIRNCNKAKLLRLIVTVVSLTFAGFGFLLTIVGSFIGRKNAAT